MPCIHLDPSILYNIFEQDIPRPLINKVTIEHYLKLVSTISFSNSDNPKVAFDSFFDQVTAAGQLAFPLSAPRKRKRNLHKPWMSVGLLSSCKMKNSLFSIKLKQPTAENIANYKIYNYTLNKCKRLAKKTILPWFI